MDAAKPPLDLVPINVDELLGELPPFVGDGDRSLVNWGWGIGSVLFGESSSSTVYDSFSLLGDWRGVYPRLGELPEGPGVGEELGVEGRRKGEVRFELKDRGDGRNGAFGVVLIASC